MTSPDIQLRTFGRDHAEEIRGLLLDTHDDAYADSDEEFDGRERFAWFVDHWSALDGYACVVAYDGTEPVGFAYGAPLAAGKEWWRGHLAPAPGHGATFALSELLVRPKWRRTGVSARLHRALIDDRPERMAVLLVDVEHPKVQALYESWGYRKVGEQRPFPDAPLYAVMLVDLEPV
ncbi:GNAT family N-acetyltransferase [Streptomyces sp. NPDC048483]|uniref:GNAT family N-acetyltransferase n=1 Tax=Streptomyces sp. NPDC048483 TaxID=3154927 RepID=UPI003420A2CC